MLAERFGCRCGRRAGMWTRPLAGPVEVPEASVVFTVKLPASLAARVRERARAAGCTISAVVAAGADRVPGAGPQTAPAR